MLVTKTNPVGIDWRIQKLQTYLHGRLATKWSIDVNDSEQSSTFMSYGRCYRNKKNEGFVAEVFTGNNEYKEVYWDDSLKAISFFGLGSKETAKIMDTVEVNLIFFVNLQKLKPSITHRADEEVRQDVKSLLGVSNYGFKYKSIEVFIDNVLKEYPGSYRNERLKSVDMHPVHCFRINFDLVYNANKNC